MANNKWIRDSLPFYINFQIASYDKKPTFSSLGVLFWLFEVYTVINI